MSENNTDKELSIDELKDVSGGIRAQGGGYKKVNSEISAGAECDPDFSPDWNPPAAKTHIKKKSAGDGNIANPYPPPID